MSFAKAATYTTSLNLKGGAIFLRNIAVKRALFRLKCKTFDSRWHWIAPGIDHEFNSYIFHALLSVAVRDQRHLWYFPVRDSTKNFDLKFRKFHVPNGTRERDIRVAQIRS